jgi:hypothetical protein
MKLFVIGLLLVLFIPLVLGIWWCLWSLWSWVLPQIWVGGPEAVIHPSYWLFVGMLLLASLIGKTLFGHGGDK